MVPGSYQVCTTSALLAHSSWGAHLSFFSLQLCVHLRTKQKVSWVPSYEAAYAFIEMRHSVRPVLHLVHPQPTPWRTILLSLAEEIGVPLVPYKTWLAALELHAEDEQAICTNPALRLLPFFRAARLAMEKDQVVGGVE